MFVGAYLSDAAATNERREKVHMNTRTIGGWALLTNVFLTVVTLIGMITSVGGDTLAVIIGEALSLLLVGGLVAIWDMQPHAGRLGWIGLIGIWCLGIATGIAFLVRLAFLFSSIDLGDLIPLSSALFWLVGSLLLGWATIRAAVFHPIIGWLLILGSVLNIVEWLLPASAGQTLVGIFVTLLQAGALGGYGLTMLRHATTDARVPIGGMVEGH
jgi:hypothetical protein